MKYQNIKSLFALFSAAFLLAGCESEYRPYDNGVFLSEAREGSSAKITIDDQGGQCTFSARVSKKNDADVKVRFNTDPAALERYNDRNGTAYNPLPENYYSFSAQEAVIKAGSIGSTPIAVAVKPFDENIDQSKKYAIPVVLESAEGASLMGDTRHLMLLIDQVIVTDVPYIATNSNMISYKFSDPLFFSQWTLEWMICMDAFNRNNVTQWNIKNALPKSTSIYTRFGDVTCPQNCFQAKVGDNKPQSGTALTAKKWYHLAFVYDGTNLMFYINGELDMTTGYGTPGEIFRIDEVTFANGVHNNYVLKGMVSELRVWSVARKAGEIANNMYTVDPATEGLEIYWKCNEGEGNIMKDSSPNGRDGVMKSAPTWKSGIRFPEGQ